MTETEKMLLGKLYDPTDPELAALREKAHVLSLEYNLLDETKQVEREKILDELVPNRGKNAYFQGPVQFDYGVFTSVGDNFYANFNFTVLDCCPVTIGDNVFIGPNCSLYTPMHGYLPSDRNMRYRADGSTYDLEYAKPITIGNDCWLGGSVVVCGGVTVGQGCVIGAGSVVTRDLPPYSPAFGNPAKVARKITQADAFEYKKELF